MILWDTYQLGEAIDTYHTRLVTFTISNQVRYVSFNTVLISLASDPYLTWIPKPRTSDAPHKWVFHCHKRLPTVDTKKGAVQYLGQNQKLIKVNPGNLR